MRVNLSKLVSLMLSLTVSLFLISCGSSDSDSDPSDTQRPAQVATPSQTTGLLNSVLLNGTYDTGCQSIQGAMFFKIQIDLNDNQITNWFYDYADANCESINEINKNIYKLDSVDDVSGKKQLHLSLIKAYEKQGENGEFVTVSDDPTEDITIGIINSTSFKLDSEELGDPEFSLQ